MSKFLKLAILVVELHLPTLQQMLVQQKMDIGNPVYTRYHRFDQTALPEIFTQIFLQLPITRFQSCSIIQATI